MPAMACHNGQDSRNQCPTLFVSCRKIGITGRKSHSNIDPAASCGDERLGVWIIGRYHYDEKF